MGSRPKPHGAFAKLASFTATEFDRANERFHLDEVHPDWRLADLFGETPATVFVHEGTVEHDGDLSLSSSGDSPGVYVIRGDLDVGGTFSFMQSDGAAVLHVTGTVRAQHVAIAYHAHLWIGRDLVVGGQLVDLMSDGGGLRVGKKTTAKSILDLGRSSSRSFAMPPTSQVVRADALAKPYIGQEAGKIIKALASGKALLAPSETSASTKAKAKAKTKAKGVETIDGPWGVWTLALVGNRMYTGGEWSMYSFGDADTHVTELDTGPHGVKRRVYAVDNAIVVVGEDGVGLRYSQDSGKTWKVAADDEGPTCMTRASDGTFWLAGIDGLLRSSKSLAGPWKRHDLDGKHGVDRVLDVAVVGKRVLLAHKGVASVEGTKVVMAKTPGKQQLNRLAVLPSGTLIAIGNKRTILRSTDAGVSWKKINAPFEKGDLEDCAWLDGSLYVVGGDENEASGVVLRSCEDGARFELLGPVLPTKMTAIAAWGDDLVIAGDGKLLYRYRGAQP